MPNAVIDRYDYHDLDEVPLPSARGASVHFPDIVRRCVLFLGNRERDQFCPRATAFVVGYVDGGLGFTYFVTAEHNISGFLSKKWEFWIRSNTKDGSFIEDKWDDPRWWFHPDNEKTATDVAVSPITFRDDEDFIIPYINGVHSIAGTSDLLSRFGVGIGDEVVITGLFRSHYGRQRNVPIVRVGNIALMKEEPVYTEYCGRTEAYLIEARSISGLSGSPVFVNMPQMQAQGSRIYLLGLMHGHFDVQNLKEDVVLDDDADGTRGINTGIGVVIPVEKIIETIRDHPELIEMRKKGIEDHRKKFGATPDLADTDASENAADPPASDENSKHREDFSRLLGEAARKRELKD
jgi:hypothetical protein